jgi:hypothetical protein
MKKAAMREDESLGRLTIGIGCLLGVLSLLHFMPIFWGWESSGVYLALAVLFALGALIAIVSGVQMLRRIRRAKRDGTWRPPPPENLMMIRSRQKMPDETAGCLVMLLFLMICAAICLIWNELTPWVVLFLLFVLWDSFIRRG